MVQLSRSTLSFAAALSLSALLAAAPAQAAQVSEGDDQAGKAKIEAHDKADKAACKPLTANARDVCHEETKAKQKNARAALKFADTGYDVAKEKCDDQAGKAKNVCVQQAKTTHIKALADLKVVKEVTSTSKDATEDKRDAELKLAREKCDSLSGDAKTGCLDAAKVRLSKS